MMAEKPILFNTEMVRAIMDGRKTQTRRLIKNIPLYAPYFEVVDGVPMACDQNGEWHPLTDFSRIQPGDVLWVRETWQRLFDYDGYVYRADYDDDEALRIDRAYVAWRPSIHMPREAARLFLRVTTVRAERLKNITEAGAIAEGFTEDPLEDGKTTVSFMCSVDCLQGTARGKFALLWNKTVRREEADRYGWKGNPWVWVIDFERIGVRA